MMEYWLKPDQQLIAFEITNDYGERQIEYMTYDQARTWLEEIITNMNISLVSGVNGAGMKQRRKNDREEDRQTPSVEGMDDGDETEQGSPGSPT